MLLKLGTWRDGWRKGIEVLLKVGTWRDGWRREIEALPKVGTWRDGWRKEIQALPDVGTWRDGWRKGIEVLPWREDGDMQGLCGFSDQEETTQTFFFISDSSPTLYRHQLSLDVQYNA